MIAPCTLLLVGSSFPPDRSRSHQLSMMITLVGAPETTHRSKPLLESAKMWSETGGKHVEAVWQSQARHARARAPRPRNKPHRTGPRSPHTTFPRFCSPFFSAVEAPRRAPRPAAPAPRDPADPDRVRHGDPAAPPGGGALAESAQGSSGLRAGGFRNRWGARGGTPTDVLCVAAVLCLCDAVASCARGALRVAS